MKLEVHKNGTKLFFITCAVRERKPLLSRLIDEATRPQLLPLGEIVKSAILAIHKIWPYAGTSDFVIMPDHFHFLMVVDFLRYKDFNPLWATHRMLDAIEAAWARRSCSPAPPDVVSELESIVTRHRALAAERRLSGTGFGAASPGGSILFERSPWLCLAFEPRQIKATRHYIRLNPARALWKLNHPDLFLCHRGIKAARLARFKAERFDGLGNLALLGSPFLLHVRLTLKKTVAEHKRAIAEIIEKARRGWIPVSGFISPGEKEALRLLKSEPGTRFIRLLPYALPDRYDPAAEDCREIAANRMAILSPFPETAAITSLEMRRNETAAHEFRNNCLALNDIAARLCVNDEN